MLLVSGATTDVRRASADRVGVLYRPGMWQMPAPGLEARVWAADNGAFGDFDAGAFVAMLAQLRGVPGCRFIAAPDVVGDADRTLALFDTWEPMIRSLGFPIALVAQDGLTPGRTPWGRVDALFIGGSTEWKLGREVETLLGVAAALGKWRHVGRVNSRRRIRHFYGLCDSIDGSGFSRFPKRIGLALAWLGECHAQPELCEVSA